MINPVSLNQLQPVQGLAGSQSTSSPEKGKFASVLEQAVGETQGLRFSAHAMQRLSERNIELTPTDRARIARSTDAASAKGSREALVLMDRLALVVGVPNRTVITVMEPNGMQDTVITNIDSVVVAADE